MGRLLAHDGDAMGDGASLRVSLLGGFRVQVGGREIAAEAWRRRKAAGLVKLLALAPGHRLHREQLHELLWPEMDAPEAANNLHRTLHLARQILEPDRLPATTPAYLHLAGDLLHLSASARPWVDLAAFLDAAGIARRARDPTLYQTALDLYAGELLPEDRYEDWAISHREEASATHVALLLDLATIEEDRGNPDAAITALRRVVAAEPAHEEARAGLMRLHARAGDRHQALRQYQQLRDALRRDLDADPDPATEKLYQEILAGRFSPDRPTDGAVAEPVEAVAILAAPTNLPSHPTSFIGRAPEMAEIRQLLDVTRLLSLTGPGGGGKTRLALEVAAGLLPLPAYADGIFFVDLAALSDPALVPDAVAMAIGLQGAPGRPARELLAEHLHAKRVLLVLDNCEHLIAACADLTVTLLRACPHLQIIATSREAMNTDGELAWRVPALTLPDQRRPPALDDLAASDAVRLFVERARFNQPGFTLTLENAPDVARLCHRLDGLPLAIELAAVRVKILSPRQIADRLDDSLALLARGSRTASPRHQTLRAVMDWSHDLLPEPERILFRRLAVFAGGFTLEAAEAVVSNDEKSTHDSRLTTHDSVLDGIASLADKSLITVEATGAQVRHRLLEPVRQYAAERLDEAWETDEIGRRHRDWCVALAEEAEPALTGPEQENWLVRLEAEHDNLRAALGWSRARGEDEAILRLGGALWRFWLARGHLVEGGRWLDGALARDGSFSPVGRAARAKALNGAGVLAYLQGHEERAVALYSAALALARELADKPGIAGAQSNLGMVAHYKGDTEQAAAAFTEALALYREIGHERGIAVALNNLGSLAKDQGDFARAATLTEESLARFRRLGDTRNVTGMLQNLADIARVRGDYARATTLCRESLDLFREAGDKLGAAESLHVLGRAAFEQGDLTHAEARYEEALALGREAGEKWQIAATLNEMGRLALARDDLTRAETLCYESLLMHRELDYKQGVAAALRHLAMVARWQGDTNRVIERHQEALGLCDEASDKPGVAACLEGLAGIEGERGAPERAARLFGAAEAARAVLGLPLPAIDRDAHGAAVAAIRDQFDRQTFLQHWATGQAMPLTEAIAEARRVAASAEPGPAEPDRAGVESLLSLSRREREVANLIAQGLTNREIAGALGMSERTADKHVSNILQKLGLTARGQVAALVGA